MKIYWIKAQAPRKALAVAKYLGFDVQYIAMANGQMKKDDYLALNPNGKAPTLVDEDVVLWEAPAIMAYLAIKAGSDLWPANNPPEQVEIIRWLSWNDCHWAREVGDYYFEHVIKARFNIGAPDREALAAKVAGTKKLAKILDDHLAGKDFVACGRLTIADFQLAAMAADWRVSEMPFKELPNIVRWLEGLERIPAWANPWPA